MVRRRRQEIHVNHERWLVSYADFITLLFAFFVVMYSISQVNQSKYRVLSETFVQAFNSPSHSLPSPDEQSEEAALPGTLNPIQVGEPAKTPAPSSIDIRNEHTGFNDTNQRDVLTEISDLFVERFADLIADKMVSVAGNELWLQIELNDSILFSSGSADPSAQAQSIFDEVSLILKEYPNPIQVEGHTDNVPVNLPRYPSNWELSAARAAAIVKWMVQKGVDPVRLSAVGYGEFQPVAENTTDAGRARNRRVVLMIARKSMPRPGVTVSAGAPAALSASPAIDDLLNNQATAAAAQFTESVLQADSAAFTSANTQETLATDGVSGQNSSISLSSEASAASVSQ